MVARSREHLNSASLFKIRNLENSRRMYELGMWVVISGVFLIPSFGDLLSGVPVSLIVAKRSAEVVFSFLVFSFPVIFNLIFGALPIELMRRKYVRFASTELEGSVSEMKMKKAEESALSNSASSTELCAFSVQELFSLYATSSRNLSQGLFNRSGVYLLVGVIVAFSGLGFFYIETLKPTTYLGVDLVIALAPKFGILFFIELVAFFFLRQYRSAMDEFRYYEAVKRKREETLALIQLLHARGKELDVVDLVKAGFFFSDGKILNKDQSTEIIEARKLEKSELEVLEKVIDAVSRSKK